MRVMLFDRTCLQTRRIPLGLSHAWAVGGRLYAARGKLDAWHGVDSWEDGLRWLRSHPRIDEVQIWGHGNWGCARMGTERLDIDSLTPGHPHHAALIAIRERMKPDALWWFRTCDTFGSDIGLRFAQRFTTLLQRPAAGHTHIIGIHQSGLHRLSPGDLPHWSPTEGLAEGTAAHPIRSTWSNPGCPNTLHFLNSAVPEGW